MIGKMIYKELKNIFRQGMFQVGAFSVVLLMGAAIAVSYQYQSVVDKQVTAANEAARERWENQGEKNQHVAAHFGTYLFKPASELAWWDHGVEKYTGVTVYTEAHKRNSALFKAVQDSPALAVWGELTPAFVMMVLMPLLAIWISFGQVAQEKSTGTYRLVMSQGISAIKWMSAKAAAVWIAMLVLVIPTCLIGSGLISGFDHIPFLSGRGALLLGVYLVYLGIFIHLTLGLSARFSKATPVLVTMLGFWVLSMWVFPKLGTLVAETVYPVPDGKVFKEAIMADIEREGIPSHAPPTPKKEAAIQQMLVQYGVDRVEALPVNFNGLRLQASEEANAPIYDRHHHKLYDQYDNQEQLFDVSGIISPFMLVRRLSMGLCRTDNWTQIAFTEACEQYRRRYIKILNDDIVKTGAPGISWEVSANNEMWASIPEFEYKLPSLKVFFEHYGLSLALLGGWFVLVLLFWGMEARQFRLEND